MQNRIEELIKICTERVPYYLAGNDGHPDYSVEFNKQKFAELLIKECCNIFVELRTRPADLAAKDVELYFGIKE